MASDMTWEKMSQTERDAVYNNAAAFPDDSALIDRWAEASKGVRMAEPAHLGLAYGPGARQTWDLFPAAQAQAPCLVFIHGGYWLRNSPDMFTCMAEGVRAHGWSAALPGYTLAPEASLTQIASEIRAALDWLAVNGKTHGIAGPVVLAGWSAGGHLTALTLDHAIVRAGLAISGLYELGPLRDTYLQPTLAITDDEVASLSPARLTLSRKPLAIAYGTAELPPFVAASRDFHAYRAAAHCPGVLMPAPGRNHYNILEDMRTPDGALTRLALSVLNT